MISLVVSGGQSGADLGAWEAAKQLGIPTKGFMPRGFKNETGFHPEFREMYNAEELESEDYPSRTRANVLAADCILWFGDKSSHGGILTYRLAKEYRRMIYDVTERSPWRAVECWIHGFGHPRVMVAGNRESSNPGIQEWTRNYLLKAFCYLRPPDRRTIRKPAVVDDREPCVLDVTFVDLMGPTYYMVKTTKRGSDIVFDNPHRECPGRLTGVWHASGKKAAQEWVERNPNYFDRFGNVP